MDESQVWPPLPLEVGDIIRDKFGPIEELTDTQFVNFLLFFNNNYPEALSNYFLVNFKERINNLQDHEVLELYIRFGSKSGKLSAFLKQILKDRGEALEARCNEAYANEGLNFTVCQEGYDIESDNGNDPKSQFRRACFRKDQDATSKFKCLKPASYPTYDSTFLNPKSSEQRIREFSKRESDRKQWEADRRLDNSDWYNTGDAYKFPEYLTIIQKKDFEGYALHFLSIEIHQDVVAIGSEAFMDRYFLQSVIFTGSNPQLSVIGQKAFFHCESLQKMAIPNSVIFIRPGAFKYCKNLKKIRLPNKLREIEDSVFSTCTNLQEIDIPDSVETISSMAFEACKNLSIVRFGKNSKLTTICRFAFAGTGTPSVIIPASVREVHCMAYESCKCVYITVEGEDTEIHERAFRRCQIKVVFINAKNKQYQRKKENARYWLNLFNYPIIITEID